MVTAHTVRARGYFLKPLFRAARVLSACPTVMSMLQVSTPIEAYQKIRWPRAADAPDVHGETVARPRIIISSTGWQSTCQSKASFVFNGQVLIRLERPAYHEADYWSARHWPTNYWPANYWPQRKISIDDQTAEAMAVFGQIAYEMHLRNGANAEPNAVPDPDNESYSEFKSFEALIEGELQDPAEWDGEYFALGLLALNWGTG